MIHAVPEDPDRTAEVAKVADDADRTATFVLADPDGTVLYPSALARGKADLAFAPGVVIGGRYELERELGRGAMGQVYLARDNLLKRPVAIKVILSPESMRRARTDAEGVQMRGLFVDEAVRGANLTHPAIATVYDHGQHKGHPFTVFEYIAGETLGALLKRRGRLPLDEVRLIVGPLAQGLDFAHSTRVVHRDLKPENIRATGQGHFKVLDLGLAREFDIPGEWRFAGTPAYASPEQVSEVAPDGRSDQYSLALIAFEMLAGRRAFLGRNWRELIEDHVHREPPRLQDLRPEIPHVVGAAIARALSKDPNLRFATCEEFAVALGCQLLSPAPPQPEILLGTEIEQMSGYWRSTRAGVNRRADGVYLVLSSDALWAAYQSEVMRWPLRTLITYNPAFAPPGKALSASTGGRPLVDRPPADRGLALGPGVTSALPPESDLDSPEARRVVHLGHESNLAAIVVFYYVIAAALVFLTVMASLGATAGTAAIMAGITATTITVAFGLRSLQAWARWAAVLLSSVCILLPSSLILARWAQDFGNPPRGVLAFLWIVTVAVNATILFVLLAPASREVFSASYREVRSETPRLQPRTLFGGDMESLRTLELEFRGGIRQQFLFSTGWECRRWRARIVALMQGRGRDGPESLEQPKVETVVLLRQRPMVRYQLLGGVDARDAKRWRAESALQIRAALMGADAILDVQEERLPEVHRTLRRLSGTAVRTVDDEGRSELRSRWFSDQTRSFTRLILLFALLSLAGKALVTIAIRSLSLSKEALPLVDTGHMANMALLAVVHGWPILLAIFLRVLQWPQLTRPAAVAVLVLGTSPLVSSFGGAFSGMLTGNGPRAVARLLAGVFSLLDPTSLALILFGVYLARRGLRSDRQYARLAPASEPRAPEIRTLAGGLAMGVSVLIGVAVCFSTILEIVG